MIKREKERMIKREGESKRTNEWINVNTRKECGINKFNVRVRERERER